MGDPKFSDSFMFLPQGGIIQEFKVGGRNITLGFPSAASYKSKNNPFCGETIGRVANRISGAKINNLNGKSYDLNANNGPNTLHGGVEGWGKKDFEGPTPVDRNGRQAVMFKYLSKDGEEGFPGTVEFRLWYFPEVQDGKTSLEIEYEVELVGDEVEETAVGVTNHRYDKTTILSINLILVLIAMFAVTSTSVEDQLLKAQRRLCTQICIRSLMIPIFLPAQ